MEYKLKKLSIRDISNLNNIYKYLESNPKCLKSLFEKTRGKNNHHATKIGVLDQQGARGSTAGIVNYRGVDKISKLSEEHPFLDDLLLVFLNFHRPDFIFNSVFITKNCQSKPHKDGNSSFSVIVTVGDFEGGGLYVEENFEKTHLFPIRTYSLEFNGSIYKHWTEPFSGTRYSLIFYN